MPLASNQVQYSLLYREPERNGVLDTCRELGITLMAYSPICQGLLSGGSRACCQWASMVCKSRQCQEATSSAATADKVAALIRSSTCPRVG